MVVFFGTTVESSQTGLRVVQVKCDKCGFGYFYELARVGTGSASAPFAVGTSSVKNRSHQQSERDLEMRLTEEAELVPCPNCNWINDELVRGYRRGRYRRLGMWAAGIACLGSFGSLLCAWFTSTGPAADQGILPYFLFGGPTIFVALAAAMLILRAWQRSRIQPNRNHPMAPVIPAGTPPAMVLNESSGKLEPAKPSRDGATQISDWIDFQVGRHSFPTQCCVCLRGADTEHALSQPVPRNLTLEIPRCAACARASKWHACRLWIISLIVALLTGAGILLMLRLDSEIFWWSFGGYAIVALALASFIASALASPVRIKTRDQSRGIFKLKFRNGAYTALLGKHISST